MLSRIAESMFWIGRYVERAEDTARILDVQTQLLLEDATVDEDLTCRDLLSIMGLEEELPERVDIAYVLDRLCYSPEHPTSIAAARAIATIAHRAATIAVAVARNRSAQILRFERTERRRQKEHVVVEINSRGAGVKIALIDASRRNPFERRFRSFSAGLAPVIAPNGTLVMYSAALSSVISDNGGDRSLFVRELLKEIRTPDLMAEETLNRTRVGVTRASRSEQVPWISSSLAEAPVTMAVATFDTRLDKPRWLTGSAAKGAAKLLRRRGHRLAAAPESFFVAGTTGPLRPGETERAHRWGQSLTSAAPFPAI